MKKIIQTLALVLALAANTVFADEATLNALFDAGVALTPEQAAEILAAQGDELVDLIEELAGSSSPEEAVVIINAAIKAAQGKDTAKFARLHGDQPDSGNSNASPHN